MVASDSLVSIPFLIEGDGTPIRLGRAGAIDLDFDAVVLGWTLLADRTGSLVVDVLRQAGPGAPASICGGAPPAILSSCKAASDGLEGWELGLHKGDVLLFEVTAVEAITRATLGLRLHRA